MFTCLDCYWVGSLDFNFLVEFKLGFPLNPQKVIHFLQGGQQQPSTPMIVQMLGREPDMEQGVSKCLPFKKREPEGALSQGFWFGTWYRG